MKTLLLTISLTFSLLASAQVPQFAVNCADDRDGTNSKDIQDVGGNKWNYSNKKDQGPYKDGVPFTGKLIQCGKKNGKVMSKTEYSKGSKHGLAYKYHKDGWLLWKKRYTFGKEDGVQKYFHPSLNMANDGKNVTNTLRTRLSYEAENGKKEGIVRAWYSNGNKEYVERYTNGVKHGEQLYYYESEKLMLNENWEHGKMQGTQTYYDPNGNVVMKAGGVLLVGHEDLGEMNWEDAMAACEAMGDGWHLPTKDELNVLYQNKDAIGGFTDDCDWSSTKANDVSAWFQVFSDGYQGFNGKYHNYYVRAVRAF
jgi:antitoxin component YwqK of YwqJK toxin-antitoxin module